MNYFITGLPRSRTAWLANFFTQGESFCAHDAILGCDSLDAFERKLDALPGVFRGDSDSALLFFAPELLRRFPDARWVVVCRDPEEVVRSLVAMPAYQNVPTYTSDRARLTVEMAQQRIHPLVGHPRAKFVRFEDLEQTTVLFSLWQWCLRDRVPWCPERAALLSAMRVEVIPERMAVDLRSAEHLAREVA